MNDLVIQNSSVFIRMCVIFKLHLWYESKGRGFEYFAFLMATSLLYC